MADVTDLSAEREVRREDYQGLFCACGQAWFDAQVCIDRNGSVTGYQWPPKCAACGTPLASPGGDT